jgi:hypothetical protein
MYCRSMEGEVNVLSSEFLVTTVIEIKTYPVLRYARNNAYAVIRTRPTHVPEKLPSNHGDSDLILSLEFTCLGGIWI